MKQLTLEQKKQIEDLVFADRFDEAVQLEASFGCAPMAYAEWTKKLVDSLETM
jgi:hypothetical protein